MEYKDFGTYDTASVDYPDFAHPVASAVENGEAIWSIALWQCKWCGHYGK